MGTLFKLFCLFLLLAPAVAAAQITADFSASPQSGCSPLVVQFTDLSSGGATGWTWNFGNGNTSTLQNPAAVYVNPGTYTVTLTATDGIGNDTETKVAYITVFQNPTSGFSATSPTSGCNPLTVNFQDLSTPGDGTISQWQWDFGDGNTSNQQNPSHTYTNAGNYTVTLVVTDDNGCSNTFTIPNYISVSNPPVADFTGAPLTSCTAPHSVTFTNNSAGSGLSYQWDFGDGNTSAATNPSHTYNATGSYTVTLIATDGNGCSDTLTRTNYIVIDAPVANFQGNPTSGCDNQPVQFTDLSTGGVSAWQWDFGDGNTSSAQNPSHLYSGAGTYTVSLIVSAPGGCFDTLVMPNYITINNAPAAGFGADTTTSCEVPFTVNFSDSSAGAVSWLWDFGDGNTSIQQNPSHTYTSPGTYSVSLIVTNAQGCTDTLIIPNYIVIQEPVVDFIGIPLAGCVPLNVNFTDLSTSNEPIVSWQWDFGDGNTSNQQNPSHTYNAQGQYTVTLIIVNSSGCSDTLTRVNYIQAGTPPLASFAAAPLIACVGENIQFSDSSINATQWLWDFGDGGTSTLQNPQYAYGDTGCYTVTLTVWNFGCMDDTVITNYICISPPVANFNLNPATGCSAPHTVFFTDQSTLPDTWFWDFGDGSTSTAQNPIHTYATTGTFLVTLTVTDTVSGCQDQATATVSISTPVANFTGAPLSGCAPLTVNFTNTSTGATGYQWDFGDGNTSGQANPAHTYNNPGIYTVTLTVTDGNGCTDVLTRPAYVQVIGPDVGFTADVTAGCAPLTVNFTDTSTSGVAITGWQWDFGDGNTSILQNPSHTYANAGTYTVTLTVTDADGCSRTATYNNYIDVTDPVAGFTFSDSVACAGYPISLTNQSSGSGLTYAWDFGDGGTSSATNPTHAYAVQDTYSIKLLVTDINGCQDSIIDTSSILIANPVANFGANPTNASCPPLLVSFTDSSGPDVVSWLWDFGDGSTSTLQNPSHVYTTAGSYDVTLIVTASTGCSDTLFVPGLVNIQGPSGTFTFSPDSGCTPLAVTFIANAQNTVSYTWDFGDGNVAIGTDTIVHTYTQTGNFHPVLILDDGLGCTFTVISPDSVVVDTIPFPDFTSLNNYLCAPDSVYFTDQTFSTQPIVSWQWDFGDGGTDSVQHPVHYYASTGIYTVKLIVTNLLGCVDSIVKPAEVVIVDPPVANFGLSDTIGCVPFSAQLTDSSTGMAPIATWQWDFGDGGTSGQQNPQYTWSSTGTWPIQLIVTDSVGCSDTATAAVQVMPPPTANFVMSDSAGCDAQTITFTADSAGIAGYLWDFGDGNTDTINPVTHTFAGQGSYTVTLVVTDTLGCTDTTSNPSPIIIDSLAANFGFNVSTGCLPVNVQFTDSSFSATSITNWQWDFGDGNTSSQQNPAHTYTSGGSYMVTLIVTGSLGCMDTITLGPIDIFDNLPPQVPPIYMVTVTSNTTDSISWQSYTGNDFSHYVLYRANPPGSANFIPVDSFFSINDTTYLDAGVNPRLVSQCYKLQVVDICGLRSSLDSSRMHCTVELDAMGMIGGTFLSWNSYVGWDSLLQYEIYRVTGYDTNTAVSIGVVAGNVNTFIDTNVVCHDEFCYRIQAFEAGGNLQRSWSDTACAAPGYLADQTPMDMVRATVENDNEILVEWLDPAPLDAVELYLEKSEDNLNWTQIQAFPPAILSYTDFLVDVHEQSYYYRITLLDSCGDLHPWSNHARSVLLDAENDNGRITLEWNAYSQWAQGVLRYEIEVFSDAAAAWQPVATVGGNVTTFEDNITQLNQPVYCYRVRAIERNGNQAISLSNTDCVPVGPGLFAPNAFTPNGDNLNERFLLKGYFLTDFQVTIYDRWGKIVYESDDLNEGWDGTYKGKVVQEGVFVWVASGRGFDGTVITKRGTVTLIR